MPKDISIEGKLEAEGLSSYCPSYVEFTDYIAHLDPSSAPGLSGLSYSMVRLWPELYLRRAYECLSEAWILRQPGEGWSEKILAPIP